MKRTLALAVSLVAFGLLRAHAAPIGPFAAICIDDSDPLGTLAVYGLTTNTCSPLGTPLLFTHTGDPELISFQVDVGSIFISPQPVDTDLYGICANCLFGLSDRFIASFTVNTSLDNITFASDVNPFPPIPAGAAVNQMSENGDWQLVDTVVAGGVPVTSFYVRSDDNIDCTPEPATLGLVSVAGLVLIVAVRRSRRA